MTSTSVPTALQHSSPIHNLWIDRFAAIDNGNILSDRERPSISPSMSIRNLKDDEWKDIEYVVGTPGARTMLPSSSMTSFWLYHSPVHGLIVVHHTRSYSLSSDGEETSSSQDGWYPITLQLLKFTFNRVPYPYPM